MFLKDKSRRTSHIINPFQSSRNGDEDSAKEVISTILDGHTQVFTMAEKVKNMPMELGQVKNLKKSTKKKKKVSKETEIKEDAIETLVETEGKPGRKGPQSFKKNVRTRVTPKIKIQKIKGTSSSDDKTDNETPEKEEQASKG